MARRRNRRTYAVFVLPGERRAPGRQSAPHNTVRRVFTLLSASHKRLLRVRRTGTPDADCRMSTAGCWLTVDGYWLLVGGCWLFTTVDWLLPVIGWRLLVNG